MTEYNTLWINEEARVNTPNSYNPKIAVDAAGNSYVAYETSQGDAIPGGTSEGAQDIVLYKLNPFGNLLWIIQDTVPNTTETDRSPQLVVDGNGVYIAYVAGTPTPPGAFPFVSGIVTVKYSLDGVRQWYRYSTEDRAGTYGDSDPFIAVDSSGNIYTVYKTLDLTNIDGYPYMIQYSPTGTTLLQTTLPFNYTNFAIRDMKYSDGALYIAFNLPQDILITKYSVAGAAIWDVSAAPLNSATFTETSPAISVDSSNIYVAYTTYGTIPGGQTADPGPIIRDTVLAKLDKNGNIIWSKQQNIYNTITSDINPDIVVSATGKIYIVYTTQDPSALTFYNLNVICTDTNGSLLWKKIDSTTYNTPKDENFVSIDIDADDNLYMSYQTSGVAPGSDIILPPSGSTFKVAVTKLGISLPCPSLTDCETCGAVCDVYAVPTTTWPVQPFPASQFLRKYSSSSLRDSKTAWETFERVEAHDAAVRVALSGTGWAPSSQPITRSIWYCFRGNGEYMAYQRGRQLHMELCPSYNWKSQRSMGIAPYVLFTVLPGCCGV